ncbi:Zn-dependent exopeptidase M28 [Moheibacter sp. BDHS18]|uniref:Zn-dependent exopeptidase M28 n=2 Tax=Moheibacter lacus TaxID=2745851 RepID=A0A838ZSJ5_9FLAO|nr:Zn-dependent exopeptidase M28 [Moheibacter lacus]
MGKSADFIADQFDKIGLEKINSSYFQEFTMPINIIKDAALKINNQKLRYGIDFIVKPNSKSISFHENPNYIFDPLDFENALKSENALIDFIQRDMLAQNSKNVVFPPHHFEVDSLNQYYKNWPSFYRPEENRNRAIFFFTKEKLTASLSQVQDSISEFFIDGKYFSNDLKINDYKIETEFQNNFKAKNVIGKIEGTNKDSLIVITAHYDHLGKVGDVYFPGASDNASGVAFLLELAKYYKKNLPKYSLVFIAFAAEEAGLLGSTYFVENPLVDLSKIKFLLNFDIMGAGEDGIQIVNSSIFTKEFELLNQINSKQNLVKQIKKRGEACNSDHCPFYEKGVPSYFVYTLGGPGHYHDIFDKGESLNLAEFEDLQKLFVEFINQF